MYILNLNKFARNLKKHTHLQTLIYISNINIYMINMRHVRIFKTINILNLISHKQTCSS